MINIKHEETKTMNCYTFKANGTWYSVGVKKVEDGFNMVTVYSNRFRDSLQGATINCYANLAQLAKRSKALANFVKLIEA